jgi:hypothetical protein
LFTLLMPSDAHYSFISIYFIISGYSS